MTDLCEYMFMDTAPKDGTEIVIPIRVEATVFWCDQMMAWVLSTPLEIEFIRRPLGWKRRSLGEEQSR